MRRKDRERSVDLAWKVFDQAPYGVLSLRDGEGGYGVPVSPARIEDVVYFHCAPVGKKLDCIAQWPQGSLTVCEVLGPDYFSCKYRSAILSGKISLVEDEAEKTNALRAITERYCPDNIADFEQYASKMKAATVCRMDVLEITGKERT